jgi:hypothetical protein
MVQFNANYFQSQILKNQVNSQVTQANLVRNNSTSVAATIPTTDVSENCIFITAAAKTASDNNTWPSAVTGTYLVDASGGFSGTKVLRKYDGSVWSTTTGLIDLEGVIFSSTSDALVANTGYTTNGSAVLTKLNATTICDCSGQTKIFDVASNGVATPKSAGRYFNLTEDSTVLYDVAYGVTDGSYTKLSNSAGSQQLTSDGTTFYSNGTIWAAYS